MKRLVFIAVFMIIFTGTLFAEGKKTFMLGYESEIIGYRNFSYSDDGGSGEYSQFSFLLGQPEMGLNLGFILGESSIVGLKFGFGMTHTSALSNSKEYLVNLRFSPFYEYMFTTSAVRPFAKAAVLFRLNNIGDYEDRTNTAWSVGCGIAGGVHFFIGDSFSIDLGALFEYSGGKTHYNFDDVENKMNTREMTLSLFFALTGWI